MLRLGLPVAGERRQLDQLLAHGEPRAFGAVAFEREVDADADARSSVRGVVECEREKALRVATVRLGLARCLDRVERVALDQGAVQIAEDRGPRNQVEHRDASGDHHQRSELPVVQPDGFGHLVQPAAPVLEHVVHGARGRAHSVARRLGAHLVPNRALVGARLDPCAHRLANLTGLRAAQLGIGGLRRGVELLGVAAPVPAPLLYAAHRDPGLALGRDQHGHVERPVLLRAEHLLALEQEEGERRGVVDDEIADGRAALELGDRRALAAALGKRDVLEARLGAEDREDGEGAGDVGVAETQIASNEVAERLGLRLGRLCLCRHGGRGRRLSLVSDTASRRQISRLRRDSLSDGSEAERAPGTNGMSQDVRVTRKPLFLSNDFGYDWLLAVEFGSVVDGKLDDEYIRLDESLALIRREPGGEVLGFVIDDFSAYEPDPSCPEAAVARFDVPVLGLAHATPAEIAMSARATFGYESTADVICFDRAVATQGNEHAEEAWRQCLGTGNLKAHFGLGYTLWELGRFQEAYRHLRFYTELTPRNSWAWCWLGKACVSLGLDAEAKAAFERAIELEAIGSFETDADEMLRALTT